MRRNPRSEDQSYDFEASPVDSWIRRHRQPDPPSGFDKHQSHSRMLPAKLRNSTSLNRANPLPRDGHSPGLATESGSSPARTVVSLRCLSCGYSAVSTTGAFARDYKACCARVRLDEDKAASPRSTDDAAYSDPSKQPKPQIQSHPHDGRPTVGVQRYEGHSKVAHRSFVKNESPMPLRVLVSYGLFDRHRRDHHDRLVELDRNQPAW